MGQKLAILQIMRAPVGGLFRHVADLSAALAARGHDVGIVVDSLANDAQTEGRLTALARHASLGIHRFAMPRVLGVGDLTVPFAVAKLAKHLSIDVMHGHGAKGGFHARLAGLGAKGIATIYTPHGGVLHYGATSASGRIFHGLERALMGRTDAIVFESAFAKAAYSEIIGAPTCRSAIVHNGLVPEEFEDVPYERDAADFVFVGELRDLKGIHILVEALAGVFAESGRPATLVMAGAGAARAALESQISALGLGERVTLVGVQPARAMFARGRIAVVPSLAESLPYIVLEAAAAGLPVIATRVGGIAEIFGPTAASLVAPNDVSALRNAMQNGLNNGHAAHDEAAIRRNYIAENFSIGTMTDGIERLYTEALAKA